jgi:hypothetical protein
MSRSRLSRCLLLAVMLAALAPAAASAQPLAPTAPAGNAPAPACLPTCGSAAHAANQPSDAGLAAHRLDLSDQAAAATVQSSDAGLAAHRRDLSVPTAAATARPACLPTCGSASVAPRVTPVSPSPLARANALNPSTAAARG